LLLLGTQFVGCTNRALQASLRMCDSCARELY